MELIRAKMFSDGFAATGKGAHEAEVSYMAKIGFGSNDVEFANDLRWFRNGIMYYSKKLGKSYAKKVLDFLERIYPLLKRMCEERDENLYTRTRNHRID